MRQCVPTTQVDGLRLGTVLLIWGDNPFLPTNKIVKVSGGVVVTDQLARIDIVMCFANVSERHFMPFMSSHGQSQFANQKTGSEVI